MNIILRWARSLYRKAILKHLIAPEIVVLMDGGICSQMHQYLLGRFFAQKGYKVSYDLSFYRTWGTDLTHRFVRNFDLLKAFPYIEITKASDFKISVYKERFYVSGNNTGKRSEDYSCMESAPPLILEVSIIGSRNCGYLLSENLLRWTILSWMRRILTYAEP